MSDLLTALFSPRAGATYRKVTETSEEGWHPLWGDYLRTPAGVDVTYETALRYMAVWACVRVISETVAMLPWHVYRRQANGDRQPVQDHPLEVLLNLRPNPEMDAFSFKQTLNAWALTWGNGYAEIERSPVGMPAALWPIDPARVRPFRQDGVLRYKVDPKGGGTPTIFRAQDIYHHHGLGYDGLQGYSVLSMAARTVGYGIAAEDFGAAFFGNGAQVGVGVEYPSKLDQQALVNLRESIERRHGGARNAFKPFVLDSGGKFSNVGFTMSGRDSQFLETRKFQVTEIARMYRVPPHKIGDLERATFSNIEQQEIAFARDSIMPWVRQMELEADWKLLLPRERGRLYTRQNMNMLMRGDSTARSEFYTKLIQIGMLSINEGRAYEELNGIGPLGDRHYIQGAMVPLEDAGRAPRAMYRKVVAQAFRRELRRHRHASDDARQRTSGNGDFAAWTHDYLAQQEPRISRELMDALGTMSDEIRAAPEALRATAEAGARRHLAEMSDLMDTGWGRSDATEDALADRWAAAMIEDLMRDLALTAMGDKA